MTVPYILIAAFSSDLTGQTANLACSAKDAGGTTRSLGSLTWAEETDAAGNATTGTYSAVGQFDPTWAYPVKVKVAITGQVGVVDVFAVRACDLAGIDASGYLNSHARAVDDKTGYTANVSGNVTVGGYAAGQDPATLTWAAGTRSLTAFGFTPASSNPGLTSAQQTELDAIKAKTDGLPAHPAATEDVQITLLKDNL